MKNFSSIIIWVIGKLLTIVMYIWLIAAAIPLFVGIFMIDICLKLFGVEQCYLLLADFVAWCAMISEHLKHLQNLKKEKIQENE